MIRDLQYRLTVEGRNYVIAVCAPGRNPAPVSAGPFDAHITVHVAELLFERQRAEPERVVRLLVDYASPLVPVSVTRERWGKFADAVLAWVCAQQAITP